MMRLVLAILNLLGYPGVGTYLAGHQRAGVIQILLHTVGFILSVGGMVVIARQAWPHCDNLVTISDWLAGNLPALALPLGVASLGMIIFLVNWLWSATTTKPVGANAKSQNPNPKETTNAKF
jgi:TRAP-type C4-dicarboxylate transport system permease small subunit